MPTKDEQAIRKVVADFAATWNAHDMNAFGELFAPNADFSVITGKLLKGRGEIESYHAELQSQLYKDSRLVWVPVDLRFLRRDVALAHVSSVQNTLTSGPPVVQTAVPK